MRQLHLDFHSEHHQSTITKLCEELEETKRQCQRQKTLSEMYITKEKEMRGKWRGWRSSRMQRPPAKRRLPVWWEKRSIFRLIMRNCRWYTSSANQRATVDLQKEEGRVKHLQEGPGKIPCFISQRKAEVWDRAEACQRAGWHSSAWPQVLDEEVQQKDILHKYYKELQGTSAAELQEKEQKKRLQEELHTEINTLSLQNDTLQRELQKEVQEKM